jgi:hypothetical protein
MAASAAGTGVFKHFWRGSAVIGLLARASGTRKYRAIGYEVRPNQIYAWKKQLLENAARAFDVGAGRDAESGRELHDKRRKERPSFQLALRNRIEWSRFAGPISIAMVLNPI